MKMADKVVDETRNEGSILNTKDINLIEKLDIQEKSRDNKSILIEISESKL